MKNPGRGLTQREGAERFKLNQARISQANTILDHAPDLADTVAAGTLPFDTAYTQATNRKEIGKRAKEKRPAAIAGKATDATPEPKSARHMAERVTGKDSNPGNTSEPTSMPDEVDSPTGKKSTPTPDQKGQCPTFLKEYGDVMHVLTRTVKRMARLTEEERFLDDAEQLAAKHGLALSEVVNTLTEVLDQLPMKAPRSQVSGGAQ